MGQIINREYIVYWGSNISCSLAYGVGACGKYMVVIKCKYGVGACGKCMLVSGVSKG